MIAERRGGTKHGYILSRECDRKIIQLKLCRDGSDFLAIPCILQC